MTATAIPVRETCECPMCDGSGHRPEFSHIANGTCFFCSGTGKFSYNTFIGPDRELRFDVYKRRGEFWYAQLRLVTRKGKVSGKDLFFKEVSDVDEARSIWRNANAVNNVWEDDYL